MSLLATILAVALVVAMCGLWFMRRQVCDLSARLRSTEERFEDAHRKLYAARKEAMPLQWRFVNSGTEWSARDMQVLAGFFNSDTGARFLRRLAATESSVAIGSAADVMHTAHSAGVAKGYGDCRKHIISLSYSCDEQRENQHASPTVEGEPSRVESEADDYLARVSPKH